MTRKDYKAIAEAVRKAMLRREEDRSGYSSALPLLAEDLAGIMARDNPRFDRIKFLEACGL